MELNDTPFELEKAVKFDLICPKIIGQCNTEDLRMTIW